jgi:hypothetical protein
MNANELTTRIVGRVLTSVILVLALATAYVHLTLGGTIFLLNGIGYLVLAAGVAASALPTDVGRRLRWLPRLGLAGFALITIGAYLVIGPYFTLGWATKAIEVAIIGVVGADLINTYGSASRLERRAVGAGHSRPSPSVQIPVE